MDKKDWRILQFTTPEITTSYSESSDELFISGEAIHATTTRNGTIFTVQELQSRSHTLIGKPLLKDHNNSVDSIVGRVVAANWDTNTNATLFKAKVTDKNARENIRNGNITNVSVGAMVDDVEEIDTEGKMTYQLKGIEFLELSLVAIPADPSAGFGVAQAVTAAFNMKKAENNSSATTPVNVQNNIPLTPANIVEETGEHNTMAENNTNEAKLAEVLSQLTGALTAVTEKVTAIEAKLEKPVVPVAVAQDKQPETRGVVGATVPKTTESNEVFTAAYDREFGTFGISMNNFNEVAKMYHKRVE